MKKIFIILLSIILIFLSINTYAYTENEDTVEEYVTEGIDNNIIIEKLNENIIPEEEEDIEEEEEEDIEEILKEDDEDKEALRKEHPIGVVIRVDEIPEIITPDTLITVRSTILNEEYYEDFKFTWQYSKDSQEWFDIEGETESILAITAQDCADKYQYIRVILEYK